MQVCYKYLSLSLKSRAKALFKYKNGPKRKKNPHALLNCPWICLFFFGYLLSIECSSMVAGNSKFAHGLETYLLSRDHTNLKSEFQLGNGKVCLCSVSLFAWVTIQRSLFWLKHLVLVSWALLNTCFFSPADYSQLHWKSASCWFGIGWTPFLVSWRLFF